MHYKTKSVLTIAVLVGFMVVVAVVINNIEGRITGAAIKPICECSANADCDDGDTCTEDICLYQDDCAASTCVHKSIEGCE